MPKTQKQIQIEKEKNVISVPWAEGDVLKVLYIPEGFSSDLEVDEKVVFSGIWEHNPWGDFDCVKVRKIGGKSTDNFYIFPKECLSYVSSEEKDLIDLASEPVESFRSDIPPGIRHAQVGGDHYKKHKIQPWDIIDCYNLGYYDGNVIKYVLRQKDKNGIEDLKKARHYLEKLIELEENND